ncbi:MAG TPA: LysR substrate-binding domain-containing protein [Azonexus sp.]
MSLDLRRLPPLDALKGFVAAARHMSFTKAGAALFLSQSAISRQVQTLESQLGVPLFRRSTRQLQLTADGEILYRAAQEAFAGLDAALRQIAAPRRPAGVTVSTSIGFAALWLVPRLAGFQEAHPEIAVRLSAENRAVDLERDEVDLAIRYCAPGEAPPGSRQLFAEALLPVVGPGLRGQLAGTGLDRTTLGQLTLLAFEDASAHPWFSWNAWLRPLGLDAAQARGHLQFNHYDQCIAAALAGQGVALGREPLLRDHLADGRLIALAPPRPVPERAYYLLAGTRADHPAVAAFTAWLLGQTDARTEA